MDIILLIENLTYSKWLPTLSGKLEIDSIVIILMKLAVTFHHRQCTQFFKYESRHSNELQKFSKKKSFFSNIQIFSLKSGENKFFSLRVQWAIWMLTQMRKALIGIRRNGHGQDRQLAQELFLSRPGMSQERLRSWSRSFEISVRTRKR